MKVNEAILSEKVNYKDFSHALAEAGIGYWDNVNSTDIIRQYISEKMSEGIQVSHILEAIEHEESEHEDWFIWLGNSMETPTPINTKQELVEALSLDEEDLNLDIEFKITNF